jgi:hypothetical protein
MRKTPKDIHRKRVDGDTMPPRWWVIWLGKPGKPGSVVLGRTERLDQYPYHRAYPATGEWPERIKTWVAAVQYLVDVHASHEARAEHVTITETEHVEVVVAGTRFDLGQVDA